MRITGILFRLTSLVLLSLVLSIALGCGYQIMGRGGEFPEGITSLAIAPLENKTKEANLNAIFVSALRREFIFRREVDIVSKDKAEASLQGAITSVTTGSIAYDREARAREYRVTITLDLLLVRQGDGKVLWRGDGIQGATEYIASTDVIVEEGRKNAAIRKIADDLAEEIYIKIKERF
jgi:outer membrane lipopolysaccharide assembly protein LptE/RlpB